MTLFLCIALSLLAASSLALAYAVRQAPEGCETEEGFALAPVARRTGRRRRRAAILAPRSALSS